MSKQKYIEYNNNGALKLQKYIHRGSMMDIWIVMQIRDVNRVPGPRDPKKLPDPGF